MNEALYLRPNGLLAGFCAHHPDATVPEIHSLGEQWAPAAFEIGTHTHAVWECYLQVDGNAVWHAAGRDHALGPGGWYLVRPGVRHRLVRPPRSHHYFYVELALDTCLARLPDCAAVFQQAAPFSTGQTTALQDAFRHLVHEVAFNSAWRGLGLRLAVDRLLLVVARELSTPVQARLIDRHPAVDQACRLIGARAGADWTVQRLARQVGLSEGHLRQLFQEDCGMSPHAYLIERRLDLAKQLLRDTDQPITRIAQACGFATSQHFARHFKRSCGCTASRWRQQEAVDQQLTPQKLRKMQRCCGVSSGLGVQALEAKSRKPGPDR